MSDEKNEIKITPTQARKNVIEEWGEMEQLSLIAEMLGVDPEEYGLDEAELYQRYDDMLDECHGPVEGLVSPYSRILKETEPTTYRCGFADWTDSEGYYEIDSTSFDEDALAKFKEAIADTLV